jgi:flavocytochrome c
MRLLTDSRDGVQGVEICSDDQSPHGSNPTQKNIYANRAVVLATGGFGNDIAFRMQQNPRLDESVQSTNHKGATAEGLVSALKVQAASVHLSWIQLGPWGCADEKGYGRGASFASYCVYPNGIVVDPVTGQRIVNEWADRRQRADAIIKTDHECVGIVDANGAKRSSESLKQCLKRGFVKAFDSVTALATSFAMPANQLEKTVDGYNRSIRENGPDPFGKPLTRAAIPLVESPFYAIRLWPKVHYTSGGVVINSKTQVMDLDYQPISHLFAAGEVCGGIHGASRLGSCSLTECIVFGRIAGQQAAAMKPHPE